MGKKGGGGVLCNSKMAAPVVWIQENPSSLLQDDCCVIRPQTDPRGAAAEPKPRFWILKCLESPRVDVLTINTPDGWSEASLMRLLWSISCWGTEYKTTNIFCSDLNPGDQRFVGLFAFLTNMSNTCPVRTLTPSSVIVLDLNSVRDFTSCIFSAQQHKQNQMSELICFFPTIWCFTDSLWTHHLHFLAYFVKNPVNVTVGSIRLVSSSSSLQSVWSHDPHWHKLQVCCVYSTTCGTRRRELLISRKRFPGKLAKLFTVYDLIKLNSIFLSLHTEGIYGGWQSSKKAPKKTQFDNLRCKHNTTKHAARRTDDDGLGSVSGTVNQTGLRFFSDCLWLIMFLQLNNMMAWLRLSAVNPAWTFSLLLTCQY